MASRKSIVGRNAELDAFAPLANSGKLRIYTGGQPATPETAASGTLLAELTMNATAFGAAAAGVITANAITGAAASAAGTAGWFRLWKSDGTTALYDGLCATSGAELNFDSVTISLGAPVAVSPLTITNPQ